MAWIEESGNDDQEAEMYKEHDVVRLKRQIEGIASGTIGAVMMVSADVPGEALVEIPDPEGKKIILIVVNEADLEAGEENERRKGE